MGLKKSFRYKEASKKSYLQKEVLNKFYPYKRVYLIWMKVRFLDRQKLPPAQRMR